MQLRIFSFHFNRQHQHTANYGVITVNGGVPETAYHCYDDCAISTYHNSGAHDYNDSFEPCSSSQHKALCRCGAYALRPHAVKSSSLRLVRGRYIVTCMECGASVDMGDTKTLTPLSLASGEAEDAAAA